MRRRGGVDGVDFDTWDGRATCFFLAPAELDFIALDEAADSAGYETVALRIQVTGRTVTGACAACDGQVTWLEVPETGQRIELAGDVAAGRTMRVSGVVADWGEHPRVTLE